MKWMVFLLCWRHVTLTHHKRTSLAKYALPLEHTRTHTTQRGWESAVVVWNAISRAREGSPTSIPHTISVRLENAHKILLDFNFSSSPGRRIFQTLRQFVQSDKRIISETHTLWTSTAKRDLFSFHFTNYCPWDKSHHTKLQLRMRFS